MESIETCEQALLEALRSSNACKRYETYKQRLDREPEKMAIVNAYRTHAFNLAKDEQAGDRLAQSQALLEEKEQICKDPDIALFLASELEMCRIIQHIYWDLATVVDLNTDSLEL